MKGKTTCPYCNKNVVVDVPDGSTGIQKTKCPNCDMSLKVEVTFEDINTDNLIHPLVKEKFSQNKKI